MVNTQSELMSIMYMWMVAGGGELLRRLLRAWMIILLGGKAVRRLVLGGLGLKFPVRHRHDGPIWMRGSGLIQLDFSKSDGASNLVMGFDESITTVAYNGTGWNRQRQRQSGRRRLGSVWKEWGIVKMSGHGLVFGVNPR